MDILIIEDEALAAEKLSQLIIRYDPTYNVLANLRSVEATVNWFAKNSSPDLLFLDIHLLDGTCFDMLKVQSISCPVIFTTAYDEYALDAFQLHSIDYLLKPISFSRLRSAFQKFEIIKDSFQHNQYAEKLDNVLNRMNRLEDTFKSRFLIKLGSRLYPISIDEVIYFYSEDQLTFLVMHDGKKHPLNYTLNELEEMINPLEFFRINRQMIIHFKSIVMVHKFLNGRLKIDLIFPLPDKSIVSSRRVGDFQTWLDR